MQHKDILNDMQYILEEDYGMTTKDKRYENDYGEDEERNGALLEIKDADGKTHVIRITEE